MNLDASPTKEQLRQLIAPCNDRAGHHVIWVDKNGEVRVSTISTEMSSHGFRQTHPEMQFRSETLLKGNEYVGPDAAADEEWVSRVLECLVTEWPKAKGKRAVEDMELSF